MVGYKDASVEEQGVASSIKAWLDDATPDIIKGTAMIASATLFSATSPLITKVKSASSFQGDLSSYLSGISNSAAMMKAKELLNTTYSFIKDPNIQGIPIHSSKESVSRQIDVSENTVIDQVTGTKLYATDNATPRPRVWRISGYLTSLSDVVDGGLLIKPTLMLQSTWIDIYAKSRRPILYKTHDCKFYKVQITDYSLEDAPDSINAKRIEISLKEYTPMKIMESQLTRISMLVKREVA